MSIIEQRVVGAKVEVSEALELVVVKLDQPVWARGSLGFDALLPVKARSAPRVHFICGSGEAADHVEGVRQLQPTNELGRLSRALPMFLAEELFLRTNARASFLLPWMRQGGFIVSARPWTREFLPPDHVPPDLLVFLHVDARATPWLLTLTIENTQRPATPVVFERAFSATSAGDDLLGVLDDLLARLTILLALRREDVAPPMVTAPDRLLPDYLASLELALALGLAARQGQEPFLREEGSIMDSLFDMVLRGRDLLRPRLLIASAIENLSKRQPALATDCLEKLRAFQRTHPQPASADQGLMDRSLALLAESIEQRAG